MIYGLWRTRLHALGGDHITIPDELEKNGQPQNEKMKFESSERHKIQARERFACQHCT